MKKTLLGLLLAGIMVMPLIAQATTPIPPTTISTPQTNESFQAMIQKLQAQILLLQLQQAQLAQNQKQFCYNWEKNLKIEDRGIDVYHLQYALQQDGTPVTGQEFSGYEQFINNQKDYSANTVFDEPLAAAVVRFQEKYSSEILAPSYLKNGTGYVGRSTRAKLNKLFDCKSVIPVQTGTPVISGVGGPTTLAVGATGTWNITAKDPDGGSLNYSVYWGDEMFATAAPGLGGMPFYAPSQTSTFTHAYSKEGKFTPTFTVTDESGLSAKASISVVVGNGILPETSFEWLPAATLGKFYNQEISTSRLTLKSGSLPNGFSLLYSALPCPLSLNNTISMCAYEPATRIQGTPTELGKMTFTLTDGTRIKEYGFYVNGNDPIPFPSVSTLLPAAKVNVFYNQVIKIGETYSALKLVSGGLPNGMYLTNTAPTCYPSTENPSPAVCTPVASEPRIQGTPSQTGKFAFTLTNGIAKQDFTLIVYGADYQPPQPTTIEMPSAVTGVYYSQRVKFGDTNTRLSLKSGTLPNGLSLDNQPLACPLSYGTTYPNTNCTYTAVANLLQGTPTQFGRFTFELTDGSQIQKYSLLVNN